MDKIPRIQVNDLEINRIPSPVVESLSPPLVNGLPLPGLNIPRPVVEVPFVRIEYPQLPFVPATPAPSSGASGQKPSGEVNRDPSRSMPNSLPPSVYTQPSQPSVTAQPPEVKETSTAVVIAGHEVEVPSPSEVVQASATAVVGTSVTLVTAMVFNQVRKVLGEAVSDAVKKKFKIKLRHVKPVIHLIYEDEGITVMEYSSEGVRTLATHISNPEQYLRDTIEADELYEADHKIVIDEPIRELFSREGAKRFNYFAPPKKLAKRLTARLTLG